MPFIAFLGCDGSGKSAVIKAVSGRLDESGTAVTQGHWRPQALTRRVEVPAIPADNPHGLPPRGLVSSILKLGWLWLNWWKGWYQGLRKASRGGVVLFDRYHSDLLVDPRRYRYGGPMILARLASRAMPQPDLVIFLDAPPEVLLSRKQEVDRASLERSRSGYRNLCGSHPRFRVVDASRPLAEVVDSVVELVRAGC
ncbi:MAG: hypothetical protein V4689_14425 [Verrucomicrobiota bacterium]